MIKILIVDDMPVFRDFLRTAIDWESYGFEICAEARNGREALEMAEEMDPDIVLADITMPYLDGIELTEKLNAFNPAISVVLITGNSKFEYAQKAIRLGVKDYIVKPFEKEELIISLLKIHDNIIRSGETNRESDKSLFLRSLIYSDSLPESKEFLQSMKETGLNPEGRSFTIASVEIEDDQSLITEESMNWKSPIGLMIREGLEEEVDVFAFDDYESRLILLLCQNDGTDDESLLREELDRLIELVREKTGFYITIGMGERETDCRNIRKSYLKSLNALNARHQFGKNRVIFSEDLARDSGDFGFYSSEMNEKIYTGLSQLNSQYVRRSITEVFERTESSRLSSENSHMVYMGLMSLLLSWIVQKGKNTAALYGDDFNPYGELSGSGSDMNKRDFILRCYDEAISHFTEARESRTHQIAMKTKELIESRYTDSNLTVEQMARRQGVNQTYLRSMFKEETGMTISEYLLKVRMEKTVELLKEGGINLTSIAESVGYGSASYLSKCFKKYYGQSPSAFRL